MGPSSGSYYRRLRRCRQNTHCAHGKEGETRSVAVMVVRSSVRPTLGWACLSCQFCSCSRATMASAASAVFSIPRWTSSYWTPKPLTQQRRSLPPSFIVNLKAFLALCSPFAVRHTHRQSSSMPGLLSFSMWLFCLSATFLDLGARPRYRNVRERGGNPTWSRAACTIETLYTAPSSVSVSFPLWHFLVETATMFFILDVLKPRPLKVHQSAHPLPFRAGTYFLGLKHAMSPLRTRWVMSLAWQKLSFLSSACSHSASWNFIFRLCYFSYTGLPLAWNAWRRGGSKWACESGNSSPGLAARL